jgi:hypothetical protein
MRYPVIVSLLGACALGSSAGFAEPLSAYRWQHRVLIAFATSAADPRVAAFEEAIALDICELHDRDLVVGYSFRDGSSRLGDRELSETDAEALRQMHPSAPDDFVVMLVGKDGGVKARYADVPWLAEIFALIDGMPMRRSEMRSRPSPCGAA